MIDVAFQHVYVYFVHAGDWVRSAVRLRGAVPSVPRMTRGEVAFFHDEDGYGFIETDDADDDVFFHISDVPGADPEEGEEFEFDIVQGDRGPRATNVERL